MAYPLFHSNHGKFIVLTDDKTSAEKQKAEKHGTVLLDRPMIVNKLYEVIVENTVHSRFLYIRAGITIQHPASLTLPIDASRWKIEAVLIGDSYVIVHGKRKESSVGALLSQLKSLHRVGLLVDSSGWLHLYINGFDQGVAARNVPLPCFAFFELLGQNTKVLCNLAFFAH
ncbi:hypothetical protein BaRGS_00012974 [Batillaria attramentaria]|uniref:NHR domain-containing protein n=1 Tax=Batillaria attramentaria TaxID=370345 RepID=A0ABD0L8L8_9CAEN